MSPASTPTFTVRHVALARAAFAAIAAVMITFTADHSATVGLSVFSGFAIASGLVWLLSAWLVFPAGDRIPPVLLGVFSGIAGIVSSTQVWRTDELFFVVVISWALVTGLVELLWGVVQRRRGERLVARDTITTGALGLLLGVALLVVPMGYELPFQNKETGESGLLTGIIIAVGILGFYVAIIAVFQALIGFTPKRRAAETAAADQDDAHDASDASEHTVAPTGKADE